MVRWGILLTTNSWGCHSFLIWELWVLLARDALELVVEDFLQRCCCASEMEVVDRNTGLHPVNISSCSPDLAVEILLVGVLRIPLPAGDIAILFHSSLPAVAHCMTLRGLVEMSVGLA